jgi:hypothetical protein
MRLSYGVVLKVLAPVHVPRDEKSVELFSGELLQSCGSLEEACIRQIPLGARFKVAAQLMGDVSAARDDTKLPMLVTQVWTRGAVVPFGKEESLASFAASRYYYLPEDSSAESRNEAYFELRKDMLRLERATSEGEALEVLLRLAGDPRLLQGAYDDPESRAAVFNGMVGRYLKSSRSRQAIERRLRLIRYWNDDEKVEAELVESGYVPAMFMQAQRLSEREQDGEGSRRLERLADKGFHPAMLAMAASYQERADALSEESAEAVRYRKQAANLFAKLNRATRNAEANRNVSGLHLLSKFYRDGLGGFDANRQEAIRLACLGRAAAQRDPRFPELILQWAEMRNTCDERWRQ